MGSCVWDSRMVLLLRSGQASCCHGVEIHLAHFKLESIFHLQLSLSLKILQQELSDPAGSGCEAVFLSFVLPHP